MHCGKPVLFINASDFALFCIDI